MQKYESLLIQELGLNPQTPSETALPNEPEL